MSAYSYKRNVEAFIWTGGPDQTEDPEWIVAALKEGRAWFSEGTDSLRLRLGEADSNYAEPGQWVIKNEYGELSFMDDADFQKAFALVEDIPSEKAKRLAQEIQNAIRTFVEGA